MADVFARQIALASSASFRSRIRLALVTAGTAIQGEAQGASSSVVWQKRQQLSEKVLNGSESYVERFAWAVAANAAIAPGDPVGIVSSTVGPPAQITTSAAHGLAVGDTVDVVGHEVNSAVNGGWIVETVPSSTTFTVPVVGTAVGSGTGSIRVQPSDSDIQFTVNSVWNDIAGVTLADG